MVWNKDGFDFLTPTKVISGRNSGFRKILGSPQLVALVVWLVGLQWKRETSSVFDGSMVTGEKEASTVA